MAEKRCQLFFCCIEHVLGESDLGRRVEDEKNKDRDGFSFGSEFCFPAYEPSVASLSPTTILILSASSLVVF